jgi:hypothetical protein
MTYGVEINYYKCNKDSIWISAAVVACMSVFILYLKLIAHINLADALNECSPFAYYSGVKKRCTNNIQKLSSKKLQNKRESFQNKDGSYRYYTLDEISADIYSFAKACLRISKNAYLAITEFVKWITQVFSDHITHITEKIADGIAVFFGEFEHDFIYPVIYKMGLIAPSAK